MQDTSHDPDECESLLQQVLPDRDALQERHGEAIGHQGEPQMRGGVRGGLSCSDEPDRVQGAREPVGVLMGAARRAGRLRRGELRRAADHRSRDEPVERGEVSRQRHLPMRHRVFLERHGPGQEATAGSVLVQRSILRSEALPADEVRHLPLGGEAPECGGARDPGEGLPRNMHLRLQPGFQRGRAPRRPQDLRHQLPVYRRIRGARELQAHHVRPGARRGERRAPCDLGPRQERRLPGRGPLRVRQGLHFERLRRRRHRLHGGMPGRRHLPEVAAMPACARGEPALREQLRVPRPDVLLRGERDLYMQHGLHARRHRRRPRSSHALRRR
mmetsp:Transcript_25968/g.74994  ORF Transcript_25968/g.74994 Transcript_25968/m.74994 type:complete len:330 (+) Transcript_25968:409-1398(+)